MNPLEEQVVELMDNYAQTRASAPQDAKKLRLKTAQTMIRMIEKQPKTLRVGQPTLYESIDEYLEDDYANLKQFVGTMIDVIASKEGYRSYTSATNMIKTMMILHEQEREKDYGGARA